MLLKRVAVYHMGARMRIFLLSLLVVCLAVTVLPVESQQPKSADSVPPKTIRVLVIDRDSWTESGTSVATKDVATSSYHAGIQEMHTEQVKTLNKSCPAVTITVDKANADLVVVWDTKTWQQTAWSGHQNEYTVYNSKGDLVGSGAAHKMTNAAKEICGILTGPAPTPKAPPKTPAKP
jgi:hypothetical protein